MDYETVLESLLSMLKSGGDAYFVLYAIATCILTQIVKKLFVSKVKVDVLHKFDFAVVLPFIFGLAFACADAFWVNKAERLGFDVIYRIAVSAAAIGALAGVMFKLCSSLSGKSLKSMLKDDVFGIFYTQLMYFGNAKEQLVNKQLTLGEFVNQVKLVSSNAVAIYETDADENAKRQKLAELLRGIVDENGVNACLNLLNAALVNYATKNKTNVKKDKQ